jgi:hypothetical protein
MGNFLMVPVEKLIFGINCEYYYLNTAKGLYRAFCSAGAGYFHFPPFEIEIFCRQV